MEGVYNGKVPETDLEKAVKDNQIGEFGICIDDMGCSGQFRYMSAGLYRGGPVPKGLRIYSIPAKLWAKFKCTGPLPQAMQSVNTKIFKEWLPGNKEYRIGGDYNIEWYSFDKKTTDPDYESEIWIPVYTKAEKQ